MNPILYVIRAGIGACWAILSASIAFAQSQPQVQSATSMLLAPTELSRLKAELIFLPAELNALAIKSDPNSRRLTVTGVYTRGDAFQPLGLVIRHGEATTSSLHTSDGIIIVDPNGKLSLHYKSRVELSGQVFDLEDEQDRESFLAQAAKAELSALQSHMLIIDGVVDVKERDDAPKFRRRIIFDTRDGRVGIYESGGTKETLYEAANALASMGDIRMALNLDMGTYNLCWERRGPEKQNCGVVGPVALSRLTNLLRITVSE